MKKYKTNKNYRKKASQQKLLPYDVIAAASQGCPEAVIEVLDHYGDYIRALSIKKFYDEKGRGRFFVDDVLHKRLEVSLMLAITKFNII